MARKTAFTHSLTSQNNIHLAMQSRSSISTYKSEGVSIIVVFLKSPRLVSTPPLLSSLLGLLATLPQAFVEQALSHTLLEEIKVIRSINHLWRQVISHAAFLLWWLLHEATYVEGIVTRINIGFELCRLLPIKTFLFGYNGYVYCRKLISVIGKGWHYCSFHECYYSPLAYVAMQCNISFSSSRRAGCCWC